MKKILCPTDFSKTAGKAVEFATNIAQRSGAHLTLIHVVHLPIVDTSETALVASELLGEQMRDASEKLKSLCRQLEETHGANREGNFTCDFVLKEALLTDVTEHLTKHEGYDLIVMGTTGCDSTMEELLIGSNTEAVIEEVKCPVLSVPATAEWQGINKIIYATDYAPGDKLALAKVVELGSVFGAPIDVVHVVKESNPEDSAKAETFWVELQQGYPGVPLQFKEIVSKRADEGLKDYFNRENGSILAVLRKEKGFLKNLFSQSLAEKMTYQAEVPLLVLQGSKV
ncbi:nucleotide-binding universal stress UspA family protein [Pontibacter aydingkolensis]|uniref:Universal stress protein n=1 Tax=Pontibacter aydingkolensis TaxID=1911536 RepID=A0ABS7CZN0_9BACT|nr:universal stress protein [Pontibacter aydingkolensis]MBW7469294.1 universal stress protein [Pontibacter aydingkolensis]